jgi:predicted O-linked N-acetylglucosamine transferase (SPINDLY family)
LAPSISESVQQTFEVSLSHDHAKELIVGLELDILIFADTMSEPMTHFLAQSRLAPVQVPGADYYFLSYCLISF